MHKMKIIVALLLFFSYPMGAQAMDCTSFSNNINDPLNEKVVTNLAQISENSVETVLKDKKEKAPDEYARSGLKLEDFKRPMLPLADNFRLFDHAILASFLGFCRIEDGNKFLADSLSKENEKNHWSKIQDFYIMIMQSNVKLLMDNQWKKSGKDCQSNVRELVHAYVQQCNP